MLFMLNGNIFSSLTKCDTDISSKEYISKILGLKSTDFYLLCNGKITNGDECTEKCVVHVIPRVSGGKGGFGSMLRAIGAQIEKTTNREACRDLSGRRLRDINEEKRLKKWINQQAEREKQAEDRRQKKIERLCQKPKHEFRDETYDKERSELPEKVEDALEQGLKASCSSGLKRKQNEDQPKKKKTKLWLGSEDELSSSVESEDSENELSTITQISAQTSDEKTQSSEKRISNEASSGENTNSECKIDQTAELHKDSVQI